MIIIKEQYKKVDVLKKFINRTKELAYLNSEYGKKGASLVVLYGRRRMGKTTLITQFGSDKNMLYFFATEESESENRNAFKRIVADYIKSDLLKKAYVNDWELLFRELLSYNPHERRLIVIDEFQYLGKANPAFPSIFQKIWDTQLKDANVMVILCGSLVSMMEEQTLAYSSPLYGRRTGQIKLGPIEFSHYHEFFEGKSRKELIEYYSVTGGVPKYIELFAGMEDVHTAIRERVISRQSFLYEEPAFLLQNEVSEVGSYFSMIRAIAAGNHKLGKIAAALEVKQTSLTKYLKTLIELDLLERQVPITEEQPEKSKRGLYFIKDHFIEFWFKFIYPYKSFIETGHADFVLEEIRRYGVDRHIAYVYETICRDEMWNLNMEHVWDFHFDKVGRWWDGQAEIDIVAFDSRGQDIIFGECKYTDQPVGTEVFYQLADKAKRVRWKDRRRESFILFSINGFTREMEDLAESRPGIVLRT